MSDSVDATPEGPSLPRSVIPVVAVNLIPSSIRARESVRRGRLVALGAVATAAVVAAGLYAYGVSDANAAQEELDAELTTQAALQVEAAQYAAVPEAYAIVDAASAGLCVAMGTDVRWSFVLNDLSLTIPTGVGLTDMTAALGAPVPIPGDDAAAQDAATAPSDVTLIGTLTYAGEAKSFPDVAAWLDSQSKQSIYDDAYLSQATKAINDSYGQQVVTFSSTVQITSLAYSGRFCPTGVDVTPGVPSTTGTPAPTGTGGDAT